MRPYSKTLVGKMARSSQAPHKVHPPLPNFLHMQGSEGAPPPPSRTANRASHVRLDASGHVLSSKGDADELGAIAAFSAQMGQMIASELAFG